jgi:choice-of-anchor A domain-containing protein
MKRFASKNALAILAGSVSLLSLVLLPSAAVASVVSLGAAGPQNFNVLEIGTGNMTIQINAGGPVNGVAGNVGLNGTGTLALTGGTFVGGNAIVSTNANQVTLSGGATVGGIIVNQALLTQARTDALNAAATAAALPSSGLGYGTLANPIDITSGGLLHAGVYYVDKFELGNNDFLHLANDGSYVFNIVGDLKINGPAGNYLDGGLSANDVLFNYLGTTAIAFSGGSNPDGSEKAFLNGIILAPNADVNLAPGQVTGEIIGGQNISIVSGSDVNGTTVVTPVPEATTALFGAALLGVIGFARRRSAAPVAGTALS